MTENRESCVGDSVNTALNLPPFAAIRAFETTFRVGGIRKAAVQLGLHHSVVSRHLRALELWLGAPLFVRRGGRLLLTREGRRYHSRITDALADIVEAGREITGRDGERPLRLWCLPVVTIQWLARELFEFERTHQPVDLKPSEVAPNLRTFDADVDIRFFRDKDPAIVEGRGLRYAELLRPQMIIVASPLLANKLPAITGPVDLLGLPLLHGMDQDDWRSWMELNGVATPETLPGPLCWHAHLAFAAAKLGRGIMLVSHFLVQQELASGDFVRLHVPGALHHSIGRYMFVGRDDRWSTGPVADLRNFLQQRLRDYEKHATVQL